MSGEGGKSYEKVIDEINSGPRCSPTDIGLLADAKGWDHRGIENPTTKLLSEGRRKHSMRCSEQTAQIRKRLKDEDLIVEDVIVGKVSKTPCSIMYIRMWSTRGLWLRSGEAYGP